MGNRSVRLPFLFFSFSGFTSFPLSGRLLFTGRRRCSINSGS